MIRGKSGVNLFCISIQRSIACSNTWHFELFLQSTVDLTTVTLHLYHSTRIGSSMEATTVTLHHTIVLNTTVLSNFVGYTTIQFVLNTIVSHVLMSSIFFLFNNYFEVNLKFEVILPS
jgi:DNA integrity scanning protein DisA with diadenylate cyclase activity